MISPICCICSVLIAPFNYLRDVCAIAGADGVGETEGVKTWSPGEVMVVSLGTDPTTPSPKSLPRNLHFVADLKIHETMFGIFPRHGRGNVG